MAVRFKLTTQFASILFAVAALSTESLPQADVPHDELEAVMSEGTDESRRDRRPGFSQVTLAHPDSMPPAEAENGHGYLDFSDQLPAQAGEAEPVN